MLAAGGFTAIPRWSPRAGRGHRRARSGAPADLVAASRRLADELGVPLSSVLLAAHAKVLAALSGERDVVTGYVAGTGALPVPADDRARVVARAAARHPSSRVAAAIARRLSGGRARARAGPDRTGFETVFDPTSG